MAERVTAQYKRRKVHLFPWTSGGPEDGSLYRQVTGCGIVVEEPDDWTEAGADVDCRRCLRQQEVAARRRDGGARDEDGGESERVMVKCRPSCDNQRTQQQAFCRSCWFSLPKNLRDEIWRLYRHEPSSRNHLEALLSAQKILESRT